MSRNASAKSGSVPPSKSGSRAPSVAASLTPSSAGTYSKNSASRPSSTKQEITYGTASGFVPSVSGSKQSITPFKPSRTKGSRTGSFLSSPKSADKSGSKGVSIIGGKKGVSTSRASALRLASRFSAMKSGNRLSPSVSGVKGSKTLSRTGLTAGSASRGRSASAGKLRIPRTISTGSGAPVFSKTKTGSSYKESSVEAITPRSRSRRSKSYTISKSKTGPSATSKLSCRTGASKCANHAHLHKGLVKAISKKGTTTAWSEVSRTKPSKDTTIDVKPRKVREIIIETRQEKVRYKTNWCAMVCLALLMCGLLVFVLVKTFSEQSAGNSTTPPSGGVTGGSTGSSGQS